MKKLAVILVYLAGWSFEVRAQLRPMLWPGHKKATIVLTYDDALISQLDSAVPQLKRAGFRATFFVTSDMDYITMPRWRKLALEGFELGNHTVFHPCTPSPDNPVSSAAYSQTQMINEIDLMNRFLWTLDGNTMRPYAYPCAETLAGGKDYVDSLRRSGTVKYARIGGDKFIRHHGLRPSGFAPCPGFRVGGSYGFRDDHRFYQKSAGCGRHGSDYVSWHRRRLYFNGDESTSGCAQLFEEE